MNTVSYLEVPEAFTFPRFLRMSADQVIRAIRDAEDAVDRRGSEGQLCAQQHESSLLFYLISQALAAVQAHLRHTDHSRHRRWPRLPLEELIRRHWPDPRAVDAMWRSPIFLRCEICGGSAEKFPCSMGSPPGTPMLEEYPEPRCDDCIAMLKSVLDDNSVS